MHWTLGEKKTIQIKSKKSTSDTQESSFHNKKEVQIIFPYIKIEKSCVQQVTLSYEKSMKTGKEVHIY